jgi:amino acid transporter
MTMSAPSGLARQTLGTVSLIFFAVSASSPLTVVAGGVIATYASTGVIGVPLSFLILGVALGLFSVGYVAMARHVSNPGPFYAYLAQGLGRIWGLAGGLLSLVSYNAIQISLYGLLGATMSGLLGGDVAWWMWALLVWAVVAWLGVLRININARVLAVLLIAEVGIILLFDAASFADPAGGSVSFAPMQPDNLLVGGIGGVFALGVAAFVGYETATVYGEEARTSNAVARATFATVTIIGVLYAISSWAMAVAVGPDGIVEAARDPESGIPFSLIEQQYGSTLKNVGFILLITSIFAAMLSFHNTVSRYIFTLARDGVLPNALGRIGSGASGGAPRVGSLIQSGIALVVFGAFAVAGLDPVLTLFTWLSTLAAIGVMVLMLLTSLAVIGFFHRNSHLPATFWQRLAAPALGALALLAVLVTTVANLGSLVGSAGALVWVFPGIVALAVIVGLVWGALLKASRPEVYSQVGVGLEEPLAALDHSLERYRL